MRKWTYLVAALLVGGATTTFTGCIDNDEPGGNRTTSRSESGIH